MKKPSTSHWTVKKYLEEIYIPDREEKINLQHKTAIYYRHVVRKLNEFAGRELKLREVTDHLIEQFYQWSQQQGCVYNTCIDRKHAIKGIVRHWSPERHPKIAANGTRELMPHWQAVDCEGSLEEIFHKCYLPENPRITSPGTISHYGRAFKLLGQCLGRIPKLEDLTDHNIGTYLRWLSSEKKLKAVTINAYAKQLKALWGWAARVRLVEHFPTIKNLPQPDVIPSAWTKGQLGDLLDACRRSQGEIAGIPASAWWEAFHYVLWDCGERTGAMLKLTWSMLKEETGHLIVPAEIRKGRQKPMVYRLKPETLEKLAAIREPERELIFPWRGSKLKTFYHHYQRLLKVAGLPYVPGKSGPQKMRRTFASYIKAAGGDATRALRHSSTRVTDDSYLDPSIADPVSPNELLFSLEVSQEGGAV